MIVILAEADASVRHPTFPPGELHSVVAIMRAPEAPLAAAELTQILIAQGFAGVNIQQFASLPLWRALLPTSQGAALRRAIRNGHDISIFMREGQTLVASAPE